MSRPSRSLPAVNYSGMDEPGGEVVARQQPVQKESDASFFADFGFSSKTATDSLGANMAAIFASPAAPTAAATKVAPIFAPSPVAGPSSGGVAKPKPKPVIGKAIAKVKPKAAGKAKAPVSGGYEMQRRALGDAVKRSISVEKWCIAARCQCTTHTTLDVFRNLICPNAADVTPATYDGATPVVVASVRGSAAAGEIFGKTKISGGTRLGSWTANKMELVFFPPSGELRCWWTML